jgi:hypothetical protein
MNSQFRKVWAIPLVLVLITIFGLLSSLLGTGYWHWLSWVAMLVPLVVIVRKIWG